MTRKTRRSADLEAQRGDNSKACVTTCPVLFTPHAYKGVEHAMSTLTSGHESEASGGAGSSVLDEEADYKALASPSNRSQAQPPKHEDSSSNSGEHITWP